MSASPIENLELRALAQRNRLHERADELRGKVEAVREKLSVSKQAREHILSASALVSVIGLALGYGAAGMFTRS
jgi:ribosomal protein L3